MTETHKNPIPFKADFMPLTWFPGPVAAQSNAALRVASLDIAAQAANPVFRTDLYAIAERAVGEPVP